MPTYMDIHEITGATADDVAQAHLKDVQCQDRHGVKYMKYWLNKDKGKLYCLCTAPNAEAADAVHREAHGLAAERIMEVTPDLADAFMGAAEANDVGAVVFPESAEHDPGTRTIMFTDIVGSTDITQRLGDKTALHLLEVHDRIVRDALAAEGGHEVKHTGDGIMAVFVSAAAAIRCAMSVQKGFAQHRKDHPEEPLRVRIGVAAGEPVEHHKDFFGSTVQLAARLCAKAAPEQILASDTVAELCTGKSLPFQDAGSVTLKGFPEPVHTHRVG
jgi:class 3 adenylate cyclase